MKFLTLSLFLLVVTGCSTPMTTPAFAVPAENAWFLEQDTSTHVSRPIYCMSDVKDGKAQPKCYRSKSFQYP